MAKSTITLPPWPGTKPASETGTTLVASKPRVPVKEVDRIAALAAVNFFYKECNLGATLLARKIGWNSDVKSILQRAAGLTVEHVERVATALNLSSEEFLSVGKKPPFSRVEELKIRFKNLDLIEKPGKGNRRR